MHKWCFTQKSSHPLIKFQPNLDGFFLVYDRETSWWSILSINPRKLLEVNQKGRGLFSALP
jgi:hypothetical protein